MKVSVIIPVYNEEKNISKILDFLLKSINPKYTKEIIIVDGGSNDKTIDIVKEFISIILIQSPKGRAIQMNEGARIASAEVLYFLHCDTFPPENFDALIINQVENKSLSGCFKMKFDSNHIVLKVSQWFTQFNFRSCRGGDQSLFVEKKLFHELQGFNENYSIYEDNEFIFRLYKSSKFSVIQKSVVTSARRYQINGYWTLQVHFFMIHFFYKLGFSNNFLKNYYSQNIKS